MQPGWLQNRLIGSVLEGLGRLLAAKTEKREELPVLGARLGAVLGASWVCLGRLWRPRWSLNQNKNAFENRSNI